MAKHSIAGIEAGFNGSMRNNSSDNRGMNVIEIVEGEMMDTYLQRYVDDLEEQDRKMLVGQSVVSTEVRVA
jgi:hypothetical protein